jgi:IS30 family transposase
MRVSHETIYLALYVQGRGALRRELHHALRSGRALRRAKKSLPNGQGKIPNMVLISERPAEVEDRAVPGHWEGDLIMGSRKTCIGTLVERTSRYVMLLKLEKNTAEQVRTAMSAKIRSLPAELRRSVTWDRGTEMSQHLQFTIDTGVQVYFCDPKSPWQRGTNENTNGLLRQYFPKGTRPRSAQPGCSRRRGTGAQRAASTNARMDDTLGAARSACCADSLNPRPDLHITLAGEEGFEPSDGGSKVRCLTTWRLPTLKTLGFVRRTLKCTLIGFPAGPEA